MWSSRACLGSLVPLVGERAAHLGWAWRPAPGQCHHPQGLDLEQERRVHGGHRLGRYEVEEGALCQGCRGLLQARLTDCPGPCPRCGVDGWKGKAASAVLGEDGAALEKGKGTVGKK